MLNLNRQSDAQILIIDDREVRRFVWEQGVLVFDRSYSRDEPGLIAYSGDMAEHDHLPVIIITDFIEESFRNETIAHVNPRDRRTILNRRLDYAYRSTPYRTARITGRESQGRRDDNVLLSAIGKPALIQPWIDPLLELRLRIQSITSVAYLLEDYIHHSRDDRIDNLLVISIDRGLKLRQTFLYRGRVLFSRSTLLSGNDNATMAADIYMESQRIRRYLERIRLLKNEAPLQLHVYSLRSENELRFNVRPYDFIFPRVINTAEQIPPERIELGEHKAGSIVLFLLQSLLRRPVENVYAPVMARRYFHLRNIARGSLAASFLLIAGTLLFKTPSIIDILNDRSQLEQTRLMTSPVSREYQRLREGFPDTPVPAREMSLIVTSAEHLREASPPPQRILQTLSRAIAGTANLDLTDVQWELSPPPRDEAALIAQYGFVPNATEDPATAIQRASLNGDVQLNVRISGLAGSANSYREAQNRVLSFIERLEAQSGVRVTPLSMPTDVRLDTTVSTTVNDRDISAPFTLELLLEDGL